MLSVFSHRGVWALKSGRLENKGALLPLPPPPPLSLFYLAALPSGAARWKGKGEGEGGEKQKKKGGRGHRALIPLPFSFFYDPPLSSSFPFLSLLFSFFFSFFFPSSQSFFFSSFCFFSKPAVQQPHEPEYLRRSRDFQVDAAILQGCCPQRCPYHSPHSHTSDMSIWAWS